MEGFGAEAPSADGGAGAADVSLAHGMENFPIEEVKETLATHGLNLRGGGEDGPTA